MSVEHLLLAVLDEERGAGRVLRSLGLTRERLAERQITLDLTERARDYFAATGYDPSYGARPLKRLLQREIETTLGRKLLAGDIGERARRTRLGREDADIYAVPGGRSRVRQLSVR